MHSSLSIHDQSISARRRIVDNENRGELASCVREHLMRVLLDRDHY
jgi:hypothetical protein